jgi:hypothetical protein
MADSIVKAARMSIYTNIRLSSDAVERAEAIALLGILLGSTVPDCMICLDALGVDPAQVCVMPCGRHFLHGDCYAQMRDRLCPVCSTDGMGEFIRGLEVRTHIELLTC